MTVCVCVCVVWVVCVCVCVGVCERVLQSISDNCTSSVVLNNK